MLPTYLQYKTNAEPISKQVIELAGVRFTFITPYLVRIEEGGFTDNATLTVINRSFCKTKLKKTAKNGLLTVETDGLILKYKEGIKLAADTLSIRLKTRPYTEWHYGDKALQNLGGTTETLDQINGACPIGDGVCAIDGYALIDDSTTPLFDSEGWFIKRQDGVKDLYFFGYGHDYEGAVKDYYNLCGRTEMLPAYALGNWWSRYNKYTTDTYLALMDEFKNKDIPIAVGIVDMDWHLTDGDGRAYVDDGWTGYTWNSKLFPDYKAFLKGLKNRNIRTALNLHPAAGVRKWDVQYMAMAKRMGQDAAKGQPVPFNCLSQDFWAAYFEVLHFPYQEDGVDFWWMDWQQGYDYQWMHKYDPTVNELECMSPLWMLSHMHYLASKKDGGRGMIFSRFAGFGSQRYPIGFSGDSVISWETLRFQTYFTATASNIGYGYWSHDLGGHMCGSRDDELNTRWLQFGVFSPIFRIHSACSPFTVREPWNFGFEAGSVASDFMRLRHRLFPYIYTMSYRNYDELIPIMRPMYHTNPEDADAYTVPGEYWYGSELIAAPITEPSDGVSTMGSAEVWLPEGRFVDFFTGFVYNGGEKIKCYRPLSQMPLFMKSGAIVPMQAHNAHDNTLGKSKSLELVIAAGDSNSFTLYEDDGLTLDYQQGKSCRTEFKLDYTDKNAVFTIEPADGYVSLVPKKRDYKLYFRGFAKGCEFDGISAEYDAKTATYTIVIKGVDVKAGAKVVIRNENNLLHDDSDYAERVTEIIMRAQCEMDQKGTWLYRATESVKVGSVMRAWFVDTPANHLAGAIFEYVHQVCPEFTPAPRPGVIMQNR